MKGWTSRLGRGRCRNDGRVAARTVERLIISADFTYYFRCRFVDDKYDFENFMFRLWELKKLAFISVRS